MGDSRSVTGSRYLEWAKTRPHARFDLATSGVKDYRLCDLGAEPDEIELSGPSAYGYEPLQQALAAKCGVPSECVVSAIGTSLANHLAMAALTTPGDEILIEEPVYEPILSLARWLGAEVRRFRRRGEDGFRLDPDEVSRSLTPRTKLVVLTNLHNPSGALTEEPALVGLRDLARRRGLRILIDEVYLEMVSVETASPVRSAFRLGEEFVVTGSLTKAYGLSGLRCGWILAERDLARRIWRLNDLFGVIPAHPAERLSVAALAGLGRIAARSRGLLEKNRALLEDFLDSRPDLEGAAPPYGTVAFPRVAGGDTDELCALLYGKYETAVAPGRFFETPDHIRIGIGGDTETLAEGLNRLAAALDELRSL